MDASFEAAFYPTLISNSRDFLMLAIRQDVEVYSSLDGYVEGVSSKASPYINLQNVQLLFLYFYGCLGFFVLVSLVSIIDIFLLKKLRAIYRKLFVRSSFLTQQMNSGDFLFPTMAIKSNPENLASVTIENNA